MEATTGLSSHIKRVLTVGTFDIPHAGHVSLMERASRIGKLTVGLNTDSYIARYKGTMPAFSFEERYGIIRLMPFVDEVVANKQDDLRPLLSEVKPDFLVIGSDWGDSYFDQIKVSRYELEKVWGVTMVYLPYTRQISTSEIKRRLYE